MVIAGCSCVLVFSAAVGASSLASANPGGTNISSEQPPDDVLAKIGTPLPLPAGVDTDPTGTAIKNAAHELAGADFGDFYHDGDVYYLGFTRDAERYLTEVQKQFPGVQMHAYVTPRGIDELDAISQEIESTMLSADPDGQILYAVPNQQAGVVEVGVQDPNAQLPAGSSLAIALAPQAASSQPESPTLAQALVAKYGETVKVVQDEPLQPTSAASLTLSDPSSVTADAAPGADTYVDPMQGGRGIYSPNRYCTAGFMYRGPAYIVNGKIVKSSERGVISAGHCFLGQAPTTNWYQGKQLLGYYARQGTVNPSRCDCGTVKTKDELITDREVSDQVFRVPGQTPFTITDIQGLNFGNRGDRVCISAAVSGYQCGTLHTGGRGNVFTLHFEGHTYHILGVHSAYFPRPFKAGDSGAPVFNPYGKKSDAFGLGIYFADSPSIPKKAYFSQAYNVQAQLNVSICTKSNPC